MWSIWALPALYHEPSINTLIHELSNFSDRINDLLAINHKPFTQKEISKRYSMLIARSIIATQLATSNLFAMNRLAYFFASTFLILSLSSCRSTYLLKENFSGDAIGSLPLHYIPGDPAGDSVSYTSVIHPRLGIQASSVTSGGKSLVFSEAPITGETAFNQWLAFKGTVSDYAQPIWFYWTAKQRNSQGQLMIDIQGVQGLWVARLRILPDGQLVRTTNVGTGAREVLGHFNATQTHTIIISLRPAARTYNITVFGTREGTASNRSNVPVLTEPSPSRPVFDFEKPAIYLRYENESFNANPAYIFESVYITRKQPD
jgi:hypothetical protein